ncbi:flavin-containing monooxygenase [Qaidamihabitans albus]|uniref:flavin-containing monooxygenase n=1 Tax=Qaidamihabitans albus TaxID=2795733 RepID=UPI0027DDFB7E|nr:NAD(P)/FAD-dependent oxidoreductase [Qaidamihabitans albus]
MNTESSPAGQEWRSSSTAGDLERLWTAVSAANFPVLLMVVHQFTGDEKWLRAPYLPSRGKGLGDHDSGGLPKHVRREIRTAAYEAIARLRDGIEPAIPTPTPEQAVRMLSVCMGEPIDPAYGPMLADELARRMRPARPGAEGTPVEVPDGFRVLVIGAGVAGIAAAHHLESMGVDYTIVDKQPEAGGNWLQNTYPGAGVDTPSHLYSFSFARNDWERHFELRDQLQDYFHRVLDGIGALPRTRFGVEVLSARYDEDIRRWKVSARNKDGSEEILVADVVISAVGVLNQKRMPDVADMDTFEGAQSHSSEWPAGLSLAGKRIALVGTGASAMQIGPAIASQVDRLTIFQRTPQWIAPFPKFMQAIPDELRMLVDTCPLYHAWYWVRLFWQFGDKVIDALRIDPKWKHQERSVNARNDGHRKFFTRYLVEQLAGRPDLVEKSLPSYPPFGKRILLDNGWYDMLRRPNVELVTEHVTRVTSSGVVDAAGQEHEADVIVWATGFQAARFVSSMEVRGIGGHTLREVWNDDDPKAYLGVSVPGFPNFFMLGGPHSFPGSGSFMHFMELQMRYLRELIGTFVERGVRALDATEKATDTYNDLVDATHANTVWSHPGLQTYYRNSAGRVVFVMPFTNLQYWDMTREVDLADYNDR